MSASSRIEWTDATWNPVTGCTAISAGCQNCYARRMALRLQAMGQRRYANGFRVTVHPETLDEPRHWRKSRMVFVCSMGDLFHKDVPNWFIQEVFRVMKECPRHTFQILTKRPERMATQDEKFWSPNVWAGVTVENQDATERLAELLDVPAAVRFISCEPLIGEVTLGNLRGVRWVIVGGETGPGARPMQPDWARAIRDHCLAAKVPFFFKRQGGPRGGSPLLDGREWREMP